MDENMIEVGERNIKTAPVIILISALLAGVFTALLMLFGFQGGLSVGERCHCAMNKVYIYTVASLISVLLQLICYHSVKSYGMEHSADDYDIWNEYSQSGKKSSIIKILITALLTTGIEFFLITFLTDQNQNILWFFQHGAVGILCFIITPVLNIASAMLACLRFPYRAWH